MKIFLKLIICALFFVSSETKAIVLDNLVGRKLDFSRIEELLKLKDDKIIKAIQDEGILFIKTRSTLKDKASFLKYIPLATDEEMLKAGIVEIPVNNGGEYKSDKDPTNQHQKPIIIVSDTINILTILHEYMHHLSYSQLPADEKIISAELGTKGYLQFMQFSLISNSFMTKSRDFNSTEATNNFIKVIKDQIQVARYGVLYRASEEIMIEYALRTMVKEKSPHYNDFRLGDGAAYARVVYQEHRTRNRVYKMNIKAVIEHVEYLAGHENFNKSEFKMDILNAADKEVDMLNKDLLKLKAFTE